MPGEHQVEPAISLQHSMATNGDSRSKRFLPFRRKAVVAALVILTIYNLVYIIKQWLGSPHPFNDFFGLWSFGKFALAAGPAIYDPVALQAFQHALNPDVPGGYPYPYPPTFLLALFPFGMVPLALAYVVWVAGSFALYTLASLGWGWRSLCGVALLAAPTTLVAVVSGQNGFLSAALLVGGLRNLKRFPVIGGILLASLTYKPQFCLLVPVVLVAARMWRAAVAAGLTVVFLIVSSSAAFGWSIWLTWIQSISQYRDLLQTNQSRFDHLMPTVMASMREVGASQLTGYSTQFILATIVAAFVWRTIAHTLDDRSIAAVIVATVLVTPYAFTYDMPMIAAALIIEGRRRQRQGIPVNVWEVAVVTYTFLVFDAMTVWTIPFVAPGLLLIIFASIICCKTSTARTFNQDDLPMARI